MAFGKKQIVLTQGDIQRRLNAQLPREVVTGVQVSSATTQIANDALRCNIILQGKRLGTTFKLKVNAHGVPSYDRASGSFYFRADTFDVEEFNFGGKGLAERMEKASQRYITNAGLQHAVSDASPKIEKWATDMAEKGAVFVLGKTPIYRLKDDFKGLVIKGSLDSLRVEGDRLVINISFLRLTISMIALFVGTVVLIIGIFAAASNPKTAPVFKFLELI